MVAVNLAQPFKTIQELTAYAKANPNKLNYASNGNGSSAHVATVLYESMAGVDMAQPAPIAAALAVFAQRVEELEALLG